MENGSILPCTRQGGYSDFATLPLITNGDQRRAAYYLPATQVPAAPSCVCVARQTGTPGANRMVMASWDWA